VIAVVNIRASDLPWLEEMKRQDPTAQHTDYRNVTLEELQASPGASLSLSSDNHLNVLNTSYDCI
jgi:hypothetical protein